MNEKDVKELLSRGKGHQVIFDPSLRADINRASLDNLVRDIKGHLLKKRRVSIVIVKE